MRRAFLAGLLGTRDTAVRDSFGDELDRWVIAAGYEPTEASDECS